MNQDFLPFMPSEFDRAQSPAASTPHDEEFKPIMPAGYDENTTIVRTRQAADRTPDIAAADMLLADSFGQPADMVSRNRDMFKQMEIDKQVNSVLASAPIVRGVYNSSDSHAALMRDDLENAVGLETLFAKRVEQFTPVSTKGLYGGEHAALTTTPKNAQQPQGFIERLPTVAMEGVQSMGHNVLSFINAISENVSLDPNANNYVEGTARDEYSGQRQLATFLQEQKQSMADNRLIPTGNWGQDFAEDVVRMGPQVAGQMATYTLGGWVPSLLFMGSQLAGGQYSELTEDEAIDKGRAFLASLANAGLQAPLETLAAGKALEVFTASGFGKFITSGLGAMATEFITEWTQAYPEALTTLWAEAEARGRSTGDSLKVFLDRLGAITKQGMYEGAVASVYGIVGGTGKVAYEYGQYKAGVADGNFFAALDESAKSSKMRERLPKAYAQLVDSITTGGPVQNVYLAPQAMREAAGDDAAFFQLAATVGITQEAIARAEELGADLGIPLSLYQAHIAGTDTSLAMRDSVKFHPEDMTLAERLSFEHEAPAQLADALYRMKADNTVYAELDAALAPVAAQLGTVYGKEVTQANMNLLKARAVIAANWWTQAGESLTPAQVVTDKWGVTLEILDQQKDNANADLYHALYRNKATTPQAFVDEVMAGTPQDKKSFLGIGYASREDIELAESEIVLASDQVRHIRDGHPDFAEWERIPEVVQHGEVVRLSKNRVTGEDAYAFVLHEGDSSLVALGSPTQSKKTGNRLTILTAFRDSPEGVKNWLEQKNTAMYQSATEITASPSPREDLPSGSGGMSGNNLSFGVPPVNTPHRGSISFTDAGAVIRLFRDSADLSTFAHESAHLFMHDMQALVSTGNAPPQVVEDMEKLQGFVAEYDDAATLQSFYEQGFQPARPSFAGKGFASLLQEEVVQVRNVAQQEKLADAFLTYLQEGRAPSPELRSAFRRFKDWLKGMYQSIMGTVQINDDVRGVFDRMLSTDADMALVEALHEQESAIAAAVNKAGYTALWEMLTDAEARQLRDAQHEAESQSREARLSTSLRLYMHSLLSKKEITAKVQEDIAAQPVYAAMDLALSEGGLSRESVVAEFGDDIAIALNKKQRGLVKKSGGLHVHDLVMMCGFASAEDMIQTMMNADPKSMAVSTRVKAELTKREAELRQSLQSDTEQNSLTGEEDYYNDSRLSALLLERRAIERRAGRKVGANAGTAGLFRQWARDMLGTMPVRDALHVDRYAAAEVRAAAESAKAMAEGKAEDAAAAKCRQVVNHAIVLEALELRKKQDSMHKALRRWEKSNLL